MSNYDESAALAEAERRTVAALAHVGTGPENEVGRNTFMAGANYESAVLLEQVRELQAELGEAQRVDVERFASLVTVTNNCMKAIVERDAAREQVRQQGEVIERVRALVDQWPDRPLSFNDDYGSAASQAKAAVLAALDGGPS